MSQLHEENLAISNFVVNLFYSRNETIEMFKNHALERYNKFGNSKLIFEFLALLTSNVVDYQKDIVAVSTLSQASAGGPCNMNFKTLEKN